MAKTIDPINATKFDANGKPYTVRINPLKESDCEPWTPSDSKKAQVLLSRNFPDKKIEDTLEMIAMLKKEIAQSLNTINAYITMPMKRQIRR